MFIEPSQIYCIKRDGKTQLGMKVKTMSRGNKTNFKEYVCFSRDCLSYVATLQATSTSVFWNQ